MNNLTPAERLFLFGKALFALLILLAALMANLGQVFSIFVAGLLLVLSVVAGWTWVTAISHSELDFEAKTVRQCFAHNPFIKTRTDDLRKFETVLSNWNFSRSGPNWISVSLSGRMGSLELARYGASSSFPANAGYGLDEPRAKALREQLSQRLNLRDQGVV